MKLLVVSYHYCREQRQDKGIHAISIKDFINQIEILGKNFSFVSLHDIKSWVQSGSTPKGEYCLLTFDDGLKEQMECLNVLQNMGIPGAFFTVSGTVEYNQICTIHKFQHSRSVLADEDIFQQLDKEFSISTFDFGDQLKGRYIYDNEFARKIKYFFSFCLNEGQKEKITKILFTQLGVDDKDFLEYFYMSYEDIIKISSAGMLGSHTTQHEPLTRLSERDALNALTHSKNYLESITNKEVYAISYPSGRGSGMSKKVAQMAKQSGYGFGFTVNYGINDSNMLLNQPFELLRVSTNDAPGGSQGSNKYLV